MTDFAAGWNACVRGEAMNKYASKEWKNGFLACMSVPKNERTEIA